jgi:hypothetical protein
VPRASDVFVPGGLPKITYNPRQSLKLEDRVRDYVEERHKILSLSGPTKCGKTVLLKTVLPPSIWVSGGAVDSADGFWQAVVDALGGFTVEAGETSSAESREDTTGVSGGVGIPNVAHVEGQQKGATASQTGRRRSFSRERSALYTATNELKKGDYILVVDDFHYIPSAAQLTIVRGLKEMVFEGLAVIFASVPHRAFDAVRVETEMTGRVDQLPIAFWSDEELKGIPYTGFEALNVTVAEEVVERLTAESFRSPHLMQAFCLQLCKENEIRETSADRREIDPPEDWFPFFRASAQSASKTAFDLLKQGPRQRTDRKARVLQDGATTDIYGAVLEAIAATGPLTELQYTELRSSLREVLKSEPPQRHEVTRVLEEMTKIAREKIEGEPVVDYDEALETLYISDPFFAYFLRWGSTS